VSIGGPRAAAALQLCRAVLSCQLLPGRCCHFWLLLRLQLTCLVLSCLCCLQLTQCGLLARLPAANRPLLQVPGDGQRAPLAGAARAGRFCLRHRQPGPLPGAQAAGLRSRLQAAGPPCGEGLVGGSCQLQRWSLAVKFGCHQSPSLILLPASASPACSPACLPVPPACLPPSLPCCRNST
jgi:hypothetical protein